MDELERKFQGQQRIKEEREKTTEEQQELIALLKETIKEKERETRKQKQTISRKEKSIKELKIFNEKLQKELIVYSSLQWIRKIGHVYNKTLYTQNVFYEKQYHFRDDLEFGEW